jgi:hypothetical protein
MATNMSRAAAGASPSPTQSADTGRTGSTTVAVVVVAMVVAAVVDVVASADCVVDDDTRTSVVEEAISAVSLTPPQAAVTRLIVSMAKGTPFRHMVK